MQMVSEFPAQNPGTVATLLCKGVVREKKKESKCEQGVLRSHCCKTRIGASREAERISQDNMWPVLIFRIATSNHSNSSSNVGLIRSCTSAEANLTLLSC